MVGNKDDLYEDQEVSFYEGLDLAKEINAIYLRTSAKNESGGIDELFEKIGKKLLDPNIVINNNISKEKKQIREKKKISEKKIKETIKTGNKKGCCS